VLFTSINLPKIYRRVTRPTYQDSIKIRPLSEIQAYLDGA
jgi:hypothetical protein